MKRSVLFYFVFSICLSAAGGITLPAYSQTHLNVGTCHWPPYEFSEGDKVSGCSTETVGQVFKRMGVTIRKLKIYPWARGMYLLKQGKIDAMYTASKDKEREKKFYFPPEDLFLSKWVFFINKKYAHKLKFDSFRDLQGKRVGVVRGYNYTPEFWEFLKKEQNYKEVRSDDLNFKKLFKNRIDYTVNEYGSGLALIKSLGLSNQIIALTDNPLKVSPMYVIFSKKNRDRGICQKFFR